MVKSKRIFCYRNNCFFFCFLGGISTSACGYGGEYNNNRAASCGETLGVNGTNIVVGSCKDPSVKSK
ncbi:Uncharacterized protein TCM_035117 [Theobroma cacao]|uniref:Uncharacterized protein n=1 Tax=Theobroma cacao TaxID=3641 RepID=A0A061FGV7_THECC|nr:Uncharacterized protein TCM_035117 [Theobroma cacao]